MRVQVTKNKGLIGHFGFQICTCNKWCAGVVYLEGGSTAFVGFGTIASGNRRYLCSIKVKPLP